MSPICPRSLYAKFHPINGTCMCCTCPSTIEVRVRCSSDGVSRLNDDVTRRTVATTLPNVAHPRRATPVDQCTCLSKNTKRRRKQIRDFIPWKNKFISSFYIPSLLSIWANLLCSANFFITIFLLGCQNSL